MGSPPGAKVPVVSGPMVQKMYLAIVEEGDRLEGSGFVGPTVRQMQGKPVSSGRRQEQKVVPKAEDEELVLTKYTTLARCPEKFALLALQPVTGQASQLYLIISNFHIGIEYNPSCSLCLNTQGFCEPNAALGKSDWTWLDRHAHQHLEG